MLKKRDPLGKSLSSMMKDAKGLNNINIKPFEKPSSETNPQNKIQTSATDNNVKGGIIQKTLPVVNTEDATIFFELERAGDLLRQKREQKGLSVIDIAGKLLYRRSIIEAIESGDWNSLPHKVYVKGYVRRYASLLGADEEIVPYMTDRPREAAFDVPQDNKTEEQRQKKQKLYEPREILIKLPNIPKKAFIFSAIIILVVGLFAFDAIRQDRAVTSKLENAVHVANNLSNGKEKKDIPQIVDTKKLMITCHERTWISIIIDGTEKQELMLKPEEVVMLNANDRFDLLVGNSGGVSIFFNGKDTGFTGQKGQVKRVTFS
jgi:transcriptional regulator with XRE-family HTH domain